MTTARAVPTGAAPPTRDTEPRPAVPDGTAAPGASPHVGPDDGAPSGDGPAAPIVVVLPGRSLLLVAGIPGAGKSTLLAGLDAPAGTRVLDSGAARAVLARLLPDATPYPAYRWLTHLTHRASVVTVALGPADTVVVHLPATSPRMRAAVRALAVLGRRAPHLLWLDTTPDQALEGQHARGRVVRARPFAAHAARARATAEALATGGETGWTSVRRTDRSGARGGLALAK
ncbi:AAA family ATPase [Pseudonocardia sp. ICBG1293]|uniref:AAA family ATPase n=1 Tax=Pseudonocardia sp. ICBG1293 TaxID=2844382 RepID=UPI0021060975|nr:AAA family ATPase [Pseudonocardia sp. ICBG1293]